MTSASKAGPARASAWGSIAATKLYIPGRRSELVSRSDLVARLEAGRKRRLTVVAAPAGSGKTTLLAEWASSGSRQFAWLSLDPEDSDPVRFWGCVLDALRTVEPGLGAEAEVALRAPGTRPVRDVLPPLLNAVADLATPIVLVLDDYHLVRGDLIHESVEFLIDHAPPTLHLVIATRSDPPLPLGRFRARGQLAELRFSELRFTNAHATEFLNHRLGLSLDEAEIEQLQRRTEGWAAGLQLAGISLREHPAPEEFIASFAGDDRHIVDYLGAEILDGLPADLRTFAVETSVLERLCAPLCAAVTSRDDAAAQLELLERMNLFVVALDSKRHWFRYHNLFRELMRYRLERLEPELVRELNRRAADWFEGEGLIEEAVRHAFAADDEESAAELVASHWAALFNRGYLATVTTWIEALPRERVLADTRLWLALIWTALDAGRVDDVEPWLVDVPDDEEARAWSSLLAALRRFKDGTVPEVADAERWAREAAGEGPGFRRTVASCIAGLTLYWHGDYDRADEVLAAGTRLALEHRNAVAAVYQLGYRAQLEIERERLERAAEHITLATDLLSAEPQADEHFTAAIVHTAGAAAAAAAGDSAAALREGERAVELAHRGAGALEVAAAVAAYDAAAARAAGSHEDAGEELSRRELQVLRLLPSGMSQREIGRELYVSLNTVKSHTKSIFRKLGVTSRGEAVSRARDLGLI